MLFAITMQKVIGILILDFSVTIMNYCKFNKLLYQALPLTTVSLSSLTSNHYGKKLASSLYIYTNIRDIIPKHIARNLYFSLFHSHLSYCLLIWGNSRASYLAPINILRHKILKIFLQLPKRTPTTDIYLKASMLPLHELFQLAACKFIYKFLHTPHNFPPALTSLFKTTSQIHYHSTRSSSSSDLYIQPFNTLIRHCNHNAIACCSPSIWNSLPPKLKLSASLPTFDKEFKKYLLTKIQYI